MAVPEPPFPPLPMATVSVAPSLRVGCPCFDSQATTTTDTVTQRPSTHENRISNSTTKNINDWVNHADQLCPPLHGWRLFAFQLPFVALGLIILGRHTCAADQVQQILTVQAGRDVRAVEDAGC